METTCTSPDDIAPSVSRNPQLECLRDMADALLQAYKAAPVPNDHAGIGTAARTLISLTRLIKAVSGDSAASKRRPPIPLSEVEPPTAEAETRPAPIPALNRKQRRREDKFRRAVKLPDHPVLALSP